MFFGLSTPEPHRTPKYVFKHSEFPWFLVATLESPLVCCQFYGPHFHPFSIHVHPLFFAQKSGKSPGCRRPPRRSLWCQGHPLAAGPSRRGGKRGNAWEIGRIWKIHENPLLLLILWLHVATCGYRDLGFEATERRNGLKSLVELSPIPTEISNCHVSGNRLWLGSNEFFNNYNY